VAIAKLQPTNKNPFLIVANEPKIGCRLGVNTNINPTIIKIVKDNDTGVEG
jgi:hypothetical protein